MTRTVTSDGFPVVFIASPWSGGPKGLRSYARRAVMDSLARWEVPFAPHLFYPRFLDDDKPKYRTYGIDCGLKILERCDLLAVYADHGISPGMHQEIEHATSHRIQVEWRYLFTRGVKQYGTDNRHSRRDEEVDTGTPR